MSEPGDLTTIQDLDDNLGDGHVEPCSNYRHLKLALYTFLSAIDRYERTGTSAAFAYTYPREHAAAATSHPLGSTDALHARDVLIAVGPRVTMTTSSDQVILETGGNGNSAPANSYDASNDGSCQSQFYGSSGPHDGSEHGHGGHRNHEDDGSASESDPGSDIHDGAEGRSDSPGPNFLQPHSPASFSPTESTGVPPDVVGTTGKSTNQRSVGARQSSASDFEAVMDVETPEAPSSRKGKRKAKVSFSESETPTQRRRPSPPLSQPKQAIFTPPLQRLRTPSRKRSSNAPSPTSVGPRSAQSSRVLSEASMSEALGHAAGSARDSNGSDEGSRNLTLRDLEHADETDLYAGRSFGPAPTPGKSTPIKSKQTARESLLITRSQILNAALRPHQSSPLVRHQPTVASSSQSSTPARTEDSRMDVDESDKEEPPAEADARNIFDYTANTTGAYAMELNIEDLLRSSVMTDGPIDVSYATNNAGESSRFSPRHSEDASSDCHGASATLEDRDSDQSSNLSGDHPGDNSGDHSGEYSGDRSGAEGEYEKLHEGETVDYDEHDEHDEVDVDSEEYSRRHASFAVKDDSEMFDAHNESGSQSYSDYSDEEESGSRSRHHVEVYDTHLSPDSDIEWTTSTPRQDQSRLSVIPEEASFGPRGHSANGTPIRLCITPERNGDHRATKSGECADTSVVGAQSVAPPDRVLPVHPQLSVASEQLARVGTGVTSMPDLTSEQLEQSQSSPCYADSTISDPSMLAKPEAISPIQRRSEPDMLQTMRPETPREERSNVAELLQTGQLSPDSLREAQRQAATQQRQSAPEADRAPNATVQHRQSAPEADRAPNAMSRDARISQSPPSMSREANANGKVRVRKEPPPPLRLVPRGASLEPPNSRQTSQEPPVSVRRSGRVRQPVQRL